MQYITDMPGLMKTNTGAIVLVDELAYEDNLRIHKSHQIEHTRVQMLENTVDDMKQSIDNLTKLVEQLLKK
jgi:hypothetical protein